MLFFFFFCQKSEASFIFSLRARWTSPFFTALPFRATILPRYMSWLVIREHGLISDFEVVV